MVPFPFAGRPSDIRRANVKRVEKGRQTMQLRRGEGGGHPGGQQGQGFGRRRTEQY
jgi:hypothetical protein